MALLPFALIALGVLYFADDLDAARQDLHCACGRREMRAVLVTGEDQAREIERGLTRLCPWCCADQSRAGTGVSKGGDVHA
jgi:uncharacterized protein CbrC (UPF0167 family)